MAIVDRHGMPLSVGTHAANHHEVALVQLRFDFYRNDAKSQQRIGGRAYDKDALDKELTQDGVEMIAPHRSRSGMKTQDGRCLRRYPHRWIVERFFACWQWKHRQLGRSECYAENLLGPVQRASVMMPPK